jgi:hypothetical protein
MTKHEEVKVTHECDICGETIECYSDWNCFTRTHGCDTGNRPMLLDICDSCREELQNWIIKIMKEQEI